MIFVSLKIKVKKAGGVRPTAKRLGLPPSNISEHLTMLNGLPSILFLEMAKKHKIPFKGKGSPDTHTLLYIAKLKLTKERLDELANILDKKGKDVLHKELEQYRTEND